MKHRIHTKMKQFFQSVADNLAAAVLTLLVVLLFVLFPLSFSRFNTVQTMREQYNLMDTYFMISNHLGQKKPYRPTSSENKKCPVPNYYWKVLLKVKRNSSGRITDASSVGFWFEHKSYKDTGKKFSDDEFVVSVNQIEQWTGFDFFVNVPDAYESATENNSSWTAFKNF